MSSPYPPDEDVIENATAAAAEIGRHIDHQSKDAESVDTKAAAILTVFAAAVPLTASRVVAMDTDQRLLSVAVTGAAAVTLVASLFEALRPRDVFSYGPDPTRMVELVDRETRKAMVLWMADSFVAARELNVAFLKRKQHWYQRALRCLIGAAVGVTWMVQTGAIR